MSHKTKKPRRGRNSNPGRFHPQPGRVFNLIIVTLLVFFGAFSGCREKASPPETGRERECRDFAAEVASAFQQSMNLKDDQSGDFQVQMKAAAKELRDGLTKACLSRELSAEVISCVQKARLENYSTMEKCIPEDYLPVFDDMENY